MDADDDSAPLSAPDLRRLSDRLRLRSSHLREEALSHALSRRRHFSGLLSHFSSSSRLSVSLLSDLSRALELLSVDPPDAEIRRLVAAIITARRELAEKEESLVVVESIAAMVDRLGQARDDLRKGELTKAAEGVRVLKERVVGKGELEEPRVFAVLREEVARCFDELQEFLAGLVEKAVCFDADGGSMGVVTVVSAGEAGDVELRQVLEALEILGVLDYGLAKVGDLMVKHVMVPIVHGNVDIYVEEDKRNDSDCNTFLKLVRLSESQLDEKGMHIYSGVVKVIKYIKTFVLYENDKWIHCFGRTAWSRVSELIINQFLSKAVPDDASKLAEFEEVIKHTVEFEDSLRDLNFISTTDGKGDKLSLFAHNVEIHFATRKRNEILAKARQMILQCEFVSSPENYVNLLFQPERCIVSKAALWLMELVQHTLEDVCLSSSKVAMELYHAARDAFLLYEATVPVKLEKQLETTGQAVVIIHNDFLYFSQEISGLAFEYRSYFPNTVKEVAVFLDLALYFQQLSENLLRKQVKLVSFNLKEAIDGANGFQNTHQLQQFDLAKFTIDQVVFTLEKVRIIWEPLLPKSIYTKSMGELLDFVFSNMTNDILLLDDLAADETLQLQRLMNMTIENLASLIESLLNDVHGKDPLTSLCKFHKLADLMDMPLKSITTLWETGELIHCGFTSSEVVNFIKATFTDSPLRKECLLRIESTSTT